jgi:TolB-like protein
MIKPKMNSSVTWKDLRLILITFLLLTCAYPLLADVVELKSGIVYDNVKASLTKESVQFLWMDKQMSFEKKLVKKIKLRSIIFKPPVTEKEKSEAEAERVRVAEALQSATDWEIDPNAKPIVGIVLFRAGNGVSLSEAESVTNLIQTGLVKTKLFTVIDVYAISKSCTEDEKDCANKIKAKVKVNKIVSGTITKLGNKFLINGYVVDTKDNSLDFAEKERADSIQKLEETSDYFSKKIAGGIMEYWDEAVTAKETEALKNIKYIWKSALIPGLGQWQYGQDKKDNASIVNGYTIGVLSMVLIRNLSMQESNKIENKNNYENSFNLFLLAPSGSGLEGIAFLNQWNTFQDYDRAADNTKIAASALIGFYLFNLIDTSLLGTNLFPRKDKTSSLFFIPTRVGSSAMRENNFSIGLIIQF